MDPSEVEEEVARIWAETLDLDTVGVDDDFAELGGTSLLAGRIASRVRERFRVEISMPVLLEASRVADMAVVVLARLLDSVEPGARDGLLG